MGLGKTVQTVSLVRMVKERYGSKYPALVVAPLSTIQHWQREFEHWSNLDAVIYHGSARGRAMARQLDLFCRPDKARGRGQAGMGVDVVITTYEQLLLDDAAPLGRQKWSVLVVDEAHRLKNPQSRLYRETRAESRSHFAVASRRRRARPAASTRPPRGVDATITSPQVPRAAGLRRALRRCWTFTIDGHAVTK